MPKTRLELAKAVLRELRIIRYDEEPPADLKAIVDEAYDGLLAEWRKQRVCYWQADSTPDIVFRPVVRLVANEVAPGFNKPYEIGNALHRLYAAVARPWSGKPVVSEYY